MTDLDPLAIDRELRLAADAWRRWRRALRSGAGLDDDPLAHTVSITGRTSFRELDELPEEDPLRRPLKRWVYRLAEQRINRVCLSRLEAARRAVSVAVDHPRAGAFTPAQMLHEALRDEPRRAQWLDALLERDQDIVALTALLWERRQEIAVRMGLDSPDGIELPGDAVVPAASAWLERSDDSAGEVVRRSASALVELALGDATAADWPAQLVPRTVHELLGGSDLVRGLPLDPGPLPRPVGASSFLRALARVGAAWVDATAPGRQPFVVAHDPYGLRRRTHGALFALLPLVPSFASLRLGVTGPRMTDHHRTLARVVLIESRAAVLRLMLRGPALQGRRALNTAFQQHAERALGVGLRRPHPGTLWRLHLDDAQRFAGLLLGAALAERLRDEHDEDWFRNPRAVDQLRSEAARSPDPIARPAALDAGSAALARLLLGGGS